jgi:hypothetical protein
LQRQKAIRAQTLSNHFRTAIFLAWKAKPLEYHQKMMFAYADHQCPQSGIRRKICLELPFGSPQLPKAGTTVEYQCPNCKKPHLFTPSVWGNSSNQDFPAENYLPGRIVNSP